MVLLDPLVFACMTQSSHPVLESVPRSSGSRLLQHEQQPGITFFAIGLIGMGILGLAVGDFAMGWQPVAPWFPARTALAYLAAVLMLVCGTGLLFKRTCVWSIRILFPYLIVWQMLKFPALVVAPKIEGVYLGFGELAVLLAGGWTLFARLGDVALPSWLGWVNGERGVRIARYYLAVWIIPIGLSHWLYLQPSIDLVPPFLPYKAFWAELAGAGQIASGIGILFGILPRVAAWAEAIQISLYTLVIWLPAILLSRRNLGPAFAHGTERLSFTAFWISWIIAAAAWVVALNMPAHRASSQKK